MYGFFQNLNKKWKDTGTSLAVKSSFRISSAERGAGSITGQGIRSHMLHSTTKRFCFKWETLTPGSLWDTRCGVSSASRLLPSSSGLALGLRAFPGERAQEGEDLSLKVLMLCVTMAGCHILDGYLTNIYEMNERKGRNYTVVSEQTWRVFERNFRKKWKSNFST